MANVYGARTKADQTNMQGGYKNVVLFAPVDTFQSMAHPTGSPSGAGDKVTITGDHVFADPGVDGWISWATKKHSVEGTWESTGEDGAKSITYKYKFTLLGDDASTLEQVRDMLNDDCIFLVKDQDCQNATEYVQLGDDCLAPTASVSGGSKTTAEGLKEYIVEVAVRDKKFFYSGDVDLKP